MRYQPIIDRLQILLTERNNHPVTLRDAEELTSQNATVLKVALQSEHMDETNVIIKITNADNDSRHRFHTEWAALQLLEEHTQQTAIAPHFYGADDSLNFFAIEYVRDATTLWNIFKQKTRNDAQQALLEYGQMLAKMHVAGKGNQQQWHHLMQKLGHDNAFPNDSSIDMRSYTEKLQMVYDGCGIELSDAVFDEINQMSATIHEDSSFCTLVHHDAGCHNVLVDDGQPYLIDFEFAQYSHALIDVAAVRMGFPPFMFGQPVGDTAVKAFEQAYREELAQTIPEAKDDVQFYGGLVAACGQYALVKFVGGGEIAVNVILKGDLNQKPDHISDEMVALYRQMIYTQHQQFVNTATEFDVFPALRDVCQQVIDQFTQYHPDLEVMPVYPAFDV